MKSDAEAEDALQEANPSAWRALAGFRSEARLSTWLMRIVINVALGTEFMLRSVEAMSVEEVSAALGLPEATVRTRFFRARGLLREGLARDVDRALADAFSFDGARCDRNVSVVMARLNDRAGVSEA